MYKSVAPSAMPFYTCLEREGRFQSAERAPTDHRGMQPRPPSLLHSISPIDSLSLYAKA
jgi:hypothetical protein